MLLDTHVWIWWLTGGGDLSTAEQRALDASAEIEPPRISSISLLGSADAALAAPSRAPASFRVVAAAGDIAGGRPRDSDRCIRDPRARPDAAMHGDPADRLVVATERAHEVPLATHDRRIRTSRLVRLWKPDSAA